MMLLKDLMMLTDLATLFFFLFSQITFIHIIVTVLYCVFIHLIIYIEPVFQQLFLLMINTSINRLIKSN